LFDILIIIGLFRFFIMAGGICIIYTSSLLFFHH